MSHTFGSVFGYGYLGRGNFYIDNRVPEPVHIRLHSFYGGENNGRSLTLSLDGGHSAEGGSIKWDNSINLTKQDVEQLIMYLMNWTMGNTWEGHIDEHESTYKHLTILEE